MPKPRIRKGEKNTRTTVDWGETTETEGEKGGAREGKGEGGERGGYGIENKGCK